MFIRDVRYPLMLISHERAKHAVVSLIHINNIARITVNKSNLTIDTYDKTYNYTYENEKEAEKMSERIMNYVHACKRDISKDVYLNVGDRFCPDVHEIVNNHVVPRNYISYKDYKKQEDEKKVMQQRWDQPGPDIDALMILEEHEKSLMVQQLK